MTYYFCALFSGLEVNYIQKSTNFLVIPLNYDDNMLEKHGFIQCKWNLDCSFFLISLQPYEPPEPEEDILNHIPGEFYVFQALIRLIFNNRAKLEKILILEKNNDQCRVGKAYKVIDDREYEDSNNFIFSNTLSLNSLLCILERFYNKIHRFDEPKDLISILNFCISRYMLGKYESEIVLSIINLWLSLEVFAAGIFRLGNKNGKLFTKSQLRDFKTFMEDILNQEMEITDLRPLELTNVEKLKSLFTDNLKKLIKISDEKYELLLNRAMDYLASLNPEELICMEEFKNDFSSIAADQVNNFATIPVKVKFVVGEILDDTDLEDLSDWEDLVDIFYTYRNNIAHNGMIPDFLGIDSEFSVNKSKFICLIEKTFINFIDSQYIRIRKRHNYWQHSLIIGTPEHLNSLEKQDRFRAHLRESGVNLKEISRKLSTFNNIIDSAFNRDIECEISGVMNEGEIEGRVFTNLQGTSFVKLNFANPQKFSDVKLIMENIYWNLEGIISEDLPFKLSFRGYMTSSKDQNRPFLIDPNYIQFHFNQLD